MSNYENQNRDSDVLGGGQGGFGTQGGAEFNSSDNSVFGNHGKQDRFDNSGSGLGQQDRFDNTRPGEQGRFDESGVRQQGGQYGSSTGDFDSSNRGDGLGNTGLGNTGVGNTGLGNTGEFGSTESGRYGDSTDSGNVGSNYGAKPSVGDKLKGTYEQVKGKVTKDAELVEQGRERKTGALGGDGLDGSNY